MPERLERLERLNDQAEHMGQQIDTAVELQRKINRLAKWRIVFGVAGVVIAGVALGGAVAAKQAADDLRRTQKTLDAVISARTTSRKVACDQYNADQLDDRASIKDSARVFFPRDQIEQLPEPRRSQLLKAVEDYDASVDARQPLRDCSPEGIDRYYQGLSK